MFSFSFTTFTKGDIKKNNPLDLLKSLFAAFGIVVSFFLTSPGPWSLVTDSAESRDQEVRDAERRKKPKNEKMHVFPLSKGNIFLKGVLLTFRHIVDHSRFCRNGTKWSSGS